MKNEEVVVRVSESTARAQKGASRMKKLHGMLTQEEKDKADTKDFKKCGNLV